ncbi:MAG: efflux RND transporter permease subunit, partial [Desulfobacteraceae bacterium]
MKTKPTLIDKIIQYQQFLLIVTMILVLFGVVALTQMPRDEFPEFTIRQGLIVGIYPGATSHQVEEQLTQKVENYLFEYEEVDKQKTHSVSRENLMVVYVEVQEDVKQPKVFWAKLRHGLNELKKELPSGVMSLTANDDFGNTSAILLAVESETKTYKELKKYIEDFENRVRKIPETSRVKHFGLQHEEINIYIDDAKLTRYGIKPLTVFSALKPLGTINYSGEIDDGKYIRPIHISSGFTTESDIADRILYSDPEGNVVRVKDVATVVREYEDPQSFIRFNGKKCLILSLEMLPGNNIVQYGNKVKKEIEQFSAEVPGDINVGIISDMPYFVSEAVVNFLKEFALAILAVILVTILLLPKRVAFVAASTIPVSILISIGLMWLAGYGLQTVSLAGLTIVLGMVVDNAIVIIDNYVEKLDNGISPSKAASSSVTELFGSVFSASLIIIVTFLPMPRILNGMFSDFVVSLPFTIAASLFISLIVSALIVPLLSTKFIKHGIMHGAQIEKKNSFLGILQKFYDRLLETSFKKKKTVILIGIATFIIGLLIIMRTPQQTFPTYQRNQFAVEVYLPVGSSLTRTSQIMQEIETILMKDSRVKDVASFVGTGSPRFNTLYAPNFPTKNYGQLLVITLSKEATNDILNDYSMKMSDIYPDAYIRWKQLDMLKATAPIEVRITGNDIPTLKQVAHTVSDLLRRTEGTQWVRNDYEENLQAVRLDLKNDM